MKQQSLFQLAKRAAADSSFMAHLIDQQARHENASWEQMASLLGISETQLVRLSLSQRPRDDFFTQDVAQIAGYSGINRVLLLHLLDCARRGMPLNHRQTSPVSSQPKLKKQSRRSRFMFKRRVWAFGFAALLMVVLGAFVLAQPISAEATLVVSAGNAVVNQAGGAIFAGATETAVTQGGIVTVSQGDTIRLGEDASAQLRLDDGSTIDLFGGTTLAVTDLVQDQNSYQARFSLLSGKTLVRVVRLLRSGDAFEVKTPSSTASVRGTIFTVEVENANISHVIVEEGVVQVNSGGQSVDVPAGSRVTAVTGQPLQVEPAQAPPNPPTRTPPTANPTAQPTATAEPTATATAVPPKLNNAPENDPPKGPPDQVPGRTPADPPGNGSPPLGDGTPPGQTDQDDDTNSGSVANVWVCHYPPGNENNPTSLLIAADAVSDHLDHGDSLGICPTPTTAAANNSSNANNGNSDNNGNNGNSGNSGNNGNNGNKGGGK